ncbi:hypothetical protein KHX94_08120 [Shewanella dokdonensis]|uniref:Apea-like HEPN domain-containing protein n=1 Tax=Shewanella dokdonensis TaxID=712036 RepID=A0ABX8DIU6_9GAMM|nr:hypothetical protein [Shewanella dokdonensis]QVK24429.1 hypothetical protein KHX94_08120 [Shewanella dokdonensis]
MLFDSIIDLIKMGDKSLNFSFISKAILIKDEPYLLFMELYRMLERVYALPTVKTLKNELSIEMGNSWEILKLIEKNTGWRKKESEGLYSILSLLDEQILIDIFDLLSHCHGSYFKKDAVDNRRKLLNNQSDQSNNEQLHSDWLNCLMEALRDYIYTTRNSYVHYREVLEPHLEREQVLSLCKALLLIINPIYIKVSG